jgi:deoxycytidylate deaminase
MKRETESLVRDDTGDPVPCPEPDPSEKGPYRPEIVLAFVAPTGSDRELVLQTTSRLLRASNYATAIVHLSKLLEERMPAGRRPDAAEPTRAWVLQDAGNQLCREACRPDALAFLAVKAIRDERERLNLRRDEAKGPNAVVPGTGYLVWSLKRPKEAETLRAIYQSRFFLISVHSPERTRLDRLVQAEADERGHLSPNSEDEAAALRLVRRDEREPKVTAGSYGQNVSDTYPLADFFIDATNTTSLEVSLKRVLDIVFGDPFATPSRSEFGMFVASAAGLKSAELGRQVGAAVLSEQGDVLATGTNEVPRPGGGHYWEGDADDDREFVRGTDTSDRLKTRLLSQVVGVIEASGGPALDQKVRDQLEAELERTRLADLIEFGRPVHAEMSAVTDAARTGRSLQDAVLYVTTFPCHLCTRIIIAAGIRSLEYIYPYPKSLAVELYERQIRAGRGVPLDNGPIPFMPFLGVAPRRYVQAFQAPAARKTTTGEAIDRHRQSPRLLVEDESGEWDLSTHIYREVHALEIAQTWLASDEATRSGT